MDRPYIICHMLVSGNNKISGSFMYTPETAGLIAEYGRIDRAFNAKAWLCGKTTMEEFSGGKRPYLDKVTVKHLRSDFIAIKDAFQYVVVIDPKGEVGYEKAYLEKGGQKSYIIVVLTESIKDAAIAHLQELGISYIFAGEEKLDLGLAMHKLKSLFKIDMLISHGGGYTNGTLLKAGLIDELSLIRVPVIEHNKNEVALFGNEEIPQPVFLLKSSEKLCNHGEWLRYFIKR